MRRVFLKEILSPHPKDERGLLVKIQQKSEISEFSSRRSIFQENFSLIFFSKFLKKRHKTRNRQYYVGGRLKQTVSRNNSLEDFKLKTNQQLLQVILAVYSEISFCWNLLGMNKVINTIIMNSGFNYINYRTSIITLYILAHQLILRFC